jgi:hypothetical protein
MSKKTKTTGSKGAKAKAGKKPTVAEAVAERKAEQEAAQTNATVHALVDAVVDQAKVEIAADAVEAEGKAKKPKATKAAKADKTAKAPKERKDRIRDDGTYSVLDAAHKVLKEAGTPLDTKTILERALAEGYWKTEGKTPAATIYAAIIREIAAKGDASRFKKTDRGQFASAS